MTRSGTDYRRQTGPRKEGEGRRRRRRRRGWHWEKIARRPIHEHCRGTITEGRGTGGKRNGKKERGGEAFAYQDRPITEEGYFPLHLAPRKEERGGDRVRGDYDEGSSSEKTAANNRTEEEKRL